jgi:hypothetical protein
MRLKFVLEDQTHSECAGEFDDETSVIAEVRRRFALPWNEEPNRAPCTSWKTCGRQYEVLVYDTDSTPWKLVGSRRALDVSAEGAALLIPEGESLT